MAKTLLLDPKTWDLHVDETGMLPLATGTYAIAQNVANQTRLFTKDAYFAQDDGIPHFAVTLGRYPAQSVMRTRIIEQALSVDEVDSAKVSFSRFEDGVLTGNIQIITTSGETAIIQI